LPARQINQKSGCKHLSQATFFVIYSRRAALAVSCDDKYLAVTVNAGGYTELHIYDIQAKAELNPPRPPKGVLSNYQQMSWSPVGHKLQL
jgi:hypothetical protein